MEKEPVGEERGAVLVEKGFWEAVSNFGVPALLAGALIVIVDRRLVLVCERLATIMERLERILAAVENRKGGDRRV